MKAAVIFGLFVLVACLQLQADAAGVRKCELERNGFVQRCGDVVGVVRCPEGTTQAWLREDLSKPFPECCARPYCKDA